MKMFEMKMHSALYSSEATIDGGTLDGVVVTADKPKSTKLADMLQAVRVEQLQQIKLIKIETKKTIDEEKNQDIKDISDTLKSDAEAAKRDETVGGIVPNSFNVLGNEIYQKHGSDYNVKEKTTRYSKRCTEGEVYKDWDKNIQDGFSRLMNALLEHKYFDNLLGKNKAKSVDQIRDMYKDYLVKQYEKNVWNADAAQFDNIKDSLFAEGSDTDPAEAIYKELTGTSLKATETEHRHAYSVRAEEKSADIKDNNSETTPESPDIKAQQQFLGADLPNYLWNLKGSGNATAISQYLPFISIDKPSDQDKRAIKDFVSLANKYGEESLFNLFENAKDNRTAQEWSSATQNFEPKVEDKSDLEAIMNAGKMYIKTQAVDVSLSDQHNIYLSILQIIKNQGGCLNAMNTFKGEIEEFNKNKLSGRERRHFDNGEALKAKCEEKNSDFYNVVSKINNAFDRKDYSNATRLFDKDISNDDLVNILADLNNDGTLNQRDAGFAKTGMQFVEIVKQIGTEIALNNLRERAKLLNETKEIGLSEDQLNGNGKEMIYLLQNIISNPKEDLVTLMATGITFTDKEKETIGMLEKLTDEKLEKATNDLLKDIDISQITSVEGITVASNEGLHQAVAAALYTEYSRGVGLGGKISFDEFVKGLSLNGGIQYGDGGVNGGLTLSYNRDINLGKGWSFTPGASIGFVPFVHFAGSGGAELANKRVNDKGVQEKIGIRGSYTNIGGAVNVFSAIAGWERDKLAGLDERAKELKNEFFEIAKPLLDKISDSLGEKNLDLRDENIRNQISEILGEMEKIKEFKPEEQEKFISNTIDFLMAYDGVDLKAESVRRVVAVNMAKRYANSRKEMVTNAVDRKPYLSGVRAGVSFVQAVIWGAPVFHAGVSFSNHKYDGYGDANWNTYTREKSEDIKENSEWNQSMLDKFNNTLHLSEGLRLTKDGFVVIPTQCLDKVNVYVNKNMKGKLAKDENGNILMPATSVMSWPSIKAGTSSYSAEFIIGGGKKSDSIKLDKSGLPEERFENKEKLAEMSNNEMLNAVLQQLKEDERFKDDTDLQGFNFSDEQLSKLKLESGKVYKLVFEKNSKGEISVDAEPSEGGKWQIEYKTERKEGIMNETAQEIANVVYGEAQKCKTNALSVISHGFGNKVAKWKSYEKFANEMKDANYEDAKKTLNTLLPNMDKQLNKIEGKNANINFSKVLDQLNDLEGADLGQALMSINNVFARVYSVHGGTEDGKYHFEGVEGARTIGKCIELRIKEIKNRIKDSGLDSSIIAAYNNLLNASEDYRKDHGEEYKDTQKSVQRFNNAVGINLGNATSAENLLFNPEIYADMQSDLDKLGLDESSKQALHKHALEEFVNNKALISPVLKSLGFAKNPKVEVGAYDNEKGQLTLDIDGKNVILNADLKFGYFAQCVNHMLILDDISATTPETGGSVSFQNNVVEGGTVSESTKATIMSTTTIDVDVAFKAGQEKKPEGDGETEAGGDKRKQGAGSSVGEDKEKTGNETGNPETGGPGSTDVSELELSGGSNQGQTPPDADKNNENDANSSQEGDANR